MIRKKKWSGADGLKQLGEDLLKALAHGGDLEGIWGEGDALAGVEPVRLAAAVAMLEHGGLAVREEGGWRLTPAGRARAVELLRAHRLVETYLARKEGRSADQLHEEADRAEHHLTSEQINELADMLNRPRFDPHGDPIPERAHDLHRPEQTHLTEIPEGQAVRIAHIEDEPMEDFEKLVDLGFGLELPLRVASQEEAQTTVELAGERIVLAHRLARHVEVTPMAGGEPYPADLRRLSTLQPGESGVVDCISPACMGPERRRLLDFGMVPGSEVCCEFKSPFGSPVAYSVRGSTLGLRDSQARNILIRRKS
jgi:DtxR family Mn-dependent transcriptional regulator